MSIIRVDEFLYDDLEFAKIDNIVTDYLIEIVNPVRAIQEFFLLFMCMLTLKIV